MSPVPIVRISARFLIILTAGALAAGCGGSSIGKRGDGTGGGESEEPGVGSRPGPQNGGFPSPSGTGGSSATGGSSGGGGAGRSAPSPVPPFGGRADAGAAAGPYAGAGMGNTNIALGWSQD